MPEQEDIGADVEGVDFLGAMIQENIAGIVANGNDNARRVVSSGEYAKRLVDAKNHQVSRCTIRLVYIEMDYSLHKMSSYVLETPCS